MVNHVNVCLEFINLTSNIVNMYKLIRKKYTYLFIIKATLCLSHEMVYVEIKMSQMHGLAQLVVGMWGGDIINYC